MIAPLRAAFFVVLLQPFLTSYAQPGDVSAIDIRALEAGPDLIELQLRPNAPWDQSDGIVNITFAIRWETAAGGTINSDLVDQFFQGGPPFCMLVGVPLSGSSGVGIDNVDADGFRYKGLNVSGNLLPSSCTFPANEWVPFARIPVAGLTGCGTFNVVDQDPYLTANNSNWFISLGGFNITGASQVVGTGVQLGACAVDCNGVVGGPAVPGSACDPGDPCVINAVLNADCECVGEAVGAPIITGITSDSPICGDAGLSLAVAATGTGELSYEWSGQGVFALSANAPSVTVSGAASGTYSVSVSSACGSTSSSIAVVVDQPQTAAISYPAGPHCAGDGILQVQLTGTVGGTFASTPAGLALNASNGSIELASSQAGTYTVTYTGPAAGACPAAQATASITVQEPPTVTFAPLGPACSTDGPLTLAATPGGGTWTGTGVDGDTFDPSAGTQELSYTVSANGCTTTATTTITVNTTPIVSVGSFPDLCSNDAPIVLVGSPPGGTWSGAGVVGDTFDPSVGTQELTYSLTQNGCTGSTSATIVVVAAPEPSIALPGALCSNGAPIDLVATPPGGTWSGTGVTGSSFDPAVGSQQVTYTVGVNGCSGSADAFIQVNDPPTVTFAPLGSVCSTDGPLTLAATPGGGTWTGTGVDGDTFDPSAGTQELSYTVSANGCTTTATTTITVNTTPIVSVGSFPDLCSNDAPIALVGSPPGGTWSGAGVEGDTFDPSVGTQELTYSLTQNGCTGSASTTVSVSEAPLAGFEVEGETQVSGTPVTFQNTSSPGAYSWDLGDGTTSNESDPVHIYTEPGTYTVVLTVEADGCTDSFSAEVTVEIGTGITQLADAGIRIWSTGDHVVVEHGITHGGPVAIDLLDLAGRRLRSEWTVGSPGRVLIPTAGLSAGIVVVVLREQGGATAVRVPLMR